MIERAAENGWEIVTSECGGCVAALLGTEIHVEFTRPRVISRNRVRTFLAPLLAREGFLTTRVTHLDEVSSRFVERLGFQHTWSDIEFKYYILTALPFSKES